MVQVGMPAAWVGWVIPEALLASHRDDAIGMREGTSTTKIPLLAFTRLPPRSADLRPVIPRRMASEFFPISFGEREGGLAGRWVRKGAPSPLLHLCATAVEDPRGALLAALVLGRTELHGAAVVVPPAHLDGIVVVVRSDWEIPG